MKKSELSLLYFPESTPAMATNHLIRWIHGCPPPDEVAGSYRLSSLVKVDHLLASEVDYQLFVRIVGRNLAKPNETHNLVSGLFYLCSVSSFRTGYEHNFLS